jgi:acetone carboxylase gamma subunit
MKTFDELGIKTSKMFDDLSLIVTSNLISRINSMQLSGMGREQVRKVIVADLITGGRIFGQLKNGVKRISKNTIEEAGNIAAMKKFESKNYKEYRWITVGKNICPDCRPRHGTTGDISFFSNIGLPKSEFSVCGHNCNCQLVPVEYLGENLEEPIKYKKPTITDVTMGGKHKKYEDALKWIYANTPIQVVQGLQKLPIDSINAVTLAFKNQLKRGGQVKIRKLRVDARGTMTAQVGTPFRKFGSEIEVLADRQQLKLNTKFFGLGDETYRLKNGKPDVLAGWSPKGTKGRLSEVVTHELGHAYAAEHIGAYGRGGAIKALTETGRKIKEVYERYKKDILQRGYEHKKTWEKANPTKSYQLYINRFSQTKKKEIKLPNGKIDYVYVSDKASLYQEVYGDVFISEYSSHNIDEWIAECFMMAETSTTPSPYAIEVRDLLLGVQ